MPKIPIVQRPNSMGHQDNAVHLSGAPSLGWNTNNGMRELGDAMNRGTAGIAHGVSGVSETAMQLQAALQATEDRNQLHELELAETRFSNETEQYFRENPVEYRNFSEYLKKSEEDMTARRKAIFDKMSNSARKQGEFYIERGRISRGDFMQKVGFQAHVTTQMLTFENQLTECAKTNNFDLAQRIIADNEKPAGEFPPLLSSELAEKYRSVYQGLQEFYDLRSKIESDGLLKMPKGWQHE